MRLSREPVNYNPQDQSDAERSAECAGCTHQTKTKPTHVLPGGQTARPQDTLHEWYTLPGVGPIDQVFTSSNHLVNNSRSLSRLSLRCSSGPSSSGPSSPQLPHVLVLPVLGRPELPHALVDQDLGRRWAPNLLHWAVAGQLGSAGTSLRYHR